MDSNAFERRAVAHLAAVLSEFTRGWNDYPHYKEGILMDCTGSITRLNLTPRPDDYGKGYLAKMQELQDE